MILEKLSPISGKYHKMDLKITKEQLEDYYKGNKLIQRAFPNLSADEREFILTGITPDEWEKLFKEK